VDGLTRLTVTDTALGAALAAVGSLPASGSGLINLTGLTDLLSLSNCSASR
jgi:hypothetical protein